MTRHLPDPDPGAGSDPDVVDSIGPVPDVEPAAAPVEAEVPKPADEDPPVYDKRGNVRPRGTKGARPMSYAERVAIAKRITAGKGSER